ncbi:fatty acid desaturase [Nitzschia inconspicua]|uniref:sphingolipid 4-desaturase n=1 Tax=Nitzschia inconspicua TaxID=303405 RepID=A0A9K3LDG5_9STRA|nr:fatty acid desaturase [Nitzschia inconspicua]
MGQQVSTTSFTRVGTDEPHRSRRKAILAKHPEILDLYGSDIRLLPVILAVMFAQLSLAVYSTQLGGWQWFLLCWSLGGTLTHWLSLGNHELAHNLCFKTTLYNELLGIFANCAQGFPSAVTFKKYHLEHHYYQGSDGIDVDIPTEWEGQFFNNTLKKVLWVILQPAFYSLRPLLVNPKPMDGMEALNFTVVIAFDAAFAYFFGIKALAFNILGTLLGMGIHPVAGHFISEHYTFKEGQETYSYYGWLNLVTFNVGYHNEHHDFPRVSWLSLPAVRAAAPEFYDPLHSYDSWSGVIYDYIFRTDIGPYSRVRRANEKADKKVE